MIIIYFLIKTIVGILLGLILLSIFFKDKLKTKELLPDYLENTQIKINPYDFVNTYLSNIHLTTLTHDIRVFPVLVPNDINFSYLSYISTLENKELLAVYLAYFESMKDILNKENINFIEPIPSNCLKKSVFDIFSFKNFEVSNFKSISFILDKKTTTIIFALGQHNFIQNSFGIFIQIDDLNL